MSSFRKPIVVKRFQPGHNEQGHWIEGDTTQFAIVASVQPLKASELEVMPEGRRTNARAIKIYTNDKLMATNQKENQLADQIYWQDNFYEVVSVDEYQMGVISHYKIYALEVLEN